MLQKLVFGLVAAVFFFAIGTAEAAKNQMVKGTVKSVSPETDVLVVNQIDGTAKKDRELSIGKDVEWTIVTPKGTETLMGRDGLKFLQGAEGSSIQVKCDKDVTVLTIKVTLKK
jgi:hypothetical protein